MILPVPWHGKTFTNGYEVDSRSLKIVLIKLVTLCIYLPIVGILDKIVL